MKYQNYKIYNDKRSHDGRFYYLYKITNLINSRYYYGVHSTYSLGDGYFGSGVLIKQAIKKYGKENFRKEFLEFFNDEQSMYQREREIVNNKVLSDPDCYNLTEGGNGNLSGYVLGKHKDTGEFIKVLITDPRWTSGEIVSINKGTHLVYDKKLNKNRRVSLEEKLNNPDLIQPYKGVVTVYDTVNKICKRVKIDDPKRKTGEYVSCSKNKITAFDLRLNKYVQVDRIKFEKDREYYKVYSENKLVYRNKLTGQVRSFNREDYIDLDVYEYVTKGHKTGHEGMICVKSLDGSIKTWVNHDDPRYISGELIPIGKNNKSTRGRICVNNGIKNKLIWPDKLNEFLKNNREWELGNIRKYKVNITKDKSNKTIFKKDLDYWISQGWRRGQFQIKSVKK